MWEIPVNIHYVSGLGGGQCSYLDQCVFALLGSEDVFDWLKEDFKRHYNVSNINYMYLAKSLPINQPAYFRIFAPACG